MSCVILFLGHIMPSQCFQSSILLTLNSWVNWRLPQSQRTRLGGSWLTRHKTERSRRSVTTRKREPESTRIEPCAARGWPELRMSSLRKQRLGPVGAGGLSASRPALGRRPRRTSGRRLRRKPISSSAGPFGSPRLGSPSPASHRAAPPRPRALVWRPAPLRHPSRAPGLQGRAQWPS